jgi:hypothetical protein
MIARRMSVSLAEIPASPREPSPAARALLFDLRGRPGFIAACLFTLLTGLLALLLCWGAPEDLAIDLAPRQQEATLLSDTLARVDVHDGEGADSDDRTHLLRFAYVVDGQRFEAQSRLTTTRTPAIAPLAPIGASVPIEIARPHPAWARVVGTRRSWLGEGVLFTLLLPAFGLSWLTLQLRERNRRLRIFRLGLAAIARATACRLDSDVESDSRPRPWRLDWTFAFNGRTCTGALTSMDEQPLRRLFDAQEFVVLFDGEQPEQSIVYVE